MGIQSLFQNLASKKVVQFPNFLLQVGEVKMSDNASNCIGVPDHIHKICSREDLCDDIYEEIEEKHSNEDWLKSKAAITTWNISLQSIIEIVGKHFPR